MITRHVLAIDQGTTNTKVLLFDDAGAVVSRAERPMAVQFPRPGLGRAGRRGAVADGRGRDRRVPGPRGRCPGRMPSASRTSANPSSCGTARPARLLGPVIVWQCRRTTDFCESLGATATRRCSSRAPASPSTRSSPRARSAGCCGTCPTVCSARRPASCARAPSTPGCCGTSPAARVHACDATNASRTQLFNLAARAGTTRCWRSSAFRERSCPSVRPSSGVLGDDGGAGPPRGRHPGGQRDRRFARGAVRARGVLGGQREGDLRHRARR